MSDLLFTMRTEFSTAVNRNEHSTRSHRIHTLRVWLIKQATIYSKILFVCYNPRACTAMHWITVINACQYFSIFITYCNASPSHHPPFNGYSFLLYSAFHLVVFSCMTYVHISPPLFHGLKLLSRYHGRQKCVKCFKKMGSLRSVTLTFKTEIISKFYHEKKNTNVWGFKRYGHNSY